MLRVHSMSPYIINNEKGTSKKQIKVVSKDGKLLHTYEVSNYDKCYIPYQSSGSYTANYIINGNFYRSDVSYTDPVDSSGLCTCCDCKYNRDNFGLYIRDGKLWKYTSTNNIAKFSDRTAEKLTWVKVTGYYRSGNGYLMGLTDKGKLYYLYNESSNSINPSKTYKDAIGGYGAVISSLSAGYALTTDNLVYDTLDEVTYPDKIAMLSGCCEYTGEGSERYSHVCMLGMDGYLHVSSSYSGKLTTLSSTPKLRYVTPGYTLYNRSKRNICLYAIGEDNHLYYITLTGDYPTGLTLIDEGIWVSMAPFTYNTSGALGIKDDGKIYKIIGSTITECPELGSNNKEIKGTTRFLVYT